MTNANGNPETIKRKRGRPRKVDSTTPTAVPDAPRRGPGRPRKLESQPATESDAIPPVKRGPGRPRKYPLATPAPGDGTPTVKRGPGRPRKSDTVVSKTDEAAVVKRGPGRPRKVQAPAPTPVESPEPEYDEGEDFEEFEPSFETSPSTLVPDMDEPLEDFEIDDSDLDFDDEFEPDYSAPPPPAPTGRRRGRPRKSELTGATYGIPPTFMPAPHDVASWMSEVGRTGFAFLRALLGNISTTNATPINPEDILTTRQVAELVKIRESDVLHAIERGELRATRIGNKYRVTRQNVSAWLD